MPNIFYRKHDGEQTNESLLTCMDVAAIIVSKNKFCHSFTLLLCEYRRWNKNNGGMHVEIQFLLV